MLFREPLTHTEIAANNLLESGDLEWYWVTVNGEDLKKTILVYINTPQNGEPVGWQKFSANSNLAHYAQSMVAMNFTFQQLQTHFDLVKDIAQNLDYSRLTRDTLWQYFANDKRGPYMIVAGVHRQLATYVHYFVWHTDIEFKPIDRAVCAISKRRFGDFTKIPAI